MKTTDFIKEGYIADDADSMQKDHEVQMARQDCYNAAKNAIELHHLLKNVSEMQGLEGWVSEKLTLAADYLKTVKEYVEYNMLGANDDMPAFSFESAEKEFDKLLNEGLSEGSLNENQEWDVYTVAQGNKPEIKGSISAPDEDSAIQAVYNDPRTYGYVSRAYAWIPFVKPKGASLPPDIGLIYDKIENSNLPTNTKNMLTSMITGNYPGGKDSPEQYYKNGKFSPKVQQYIDKISQQGLSEVSDDNRQWSNKEEEKFRRSVADIDSMFSKDDAWTKTKQKQIKQQIKTKPMAGPKGQLPEQGVAEVSARKEKVNEIDPRNYDSDWDYQAALNRKSKRYDDDDVDLPDDEDNFDPDELSNYEKYVNNLPEGKQKAVKESAGGISAGAFATGPAGGLGGKPGTGMPKKVGNVIKRNNPKFGKGIY